MYPNLFTIGAAKSGTSSLHYYLSLHPEIHMSREKEPHYFSQLASSGSQPTYTDSQYQALFESHRPVRGESSVTYSLWPYPSGIPKLIHAVAPDAKFIYLVRDPVERIVSHYNHRVALGTENRSLSAVIADPHDRTERYLAASSYATQFEQYLKRFPEDRFLVMDHVDLLQNRESALREAFAFLGVDPDFRSAGFAATVNEGRDDRRFSPLGQRLRTSDLYRRATGWIRPDIRRKLMKPMRTAVSKPVPKSAPTAAEVEVLADKLRGEADRLRAMTGKHFGSWSV